MIPESCHLTMLCCGDIPLNKSINVINIFKTDRGIMGEGVKQDIEQEVAVIRQNKRIGRIF